MCDSVLHLERPCTPGPPRLVVGSPISRGCGYVLALPERIPGAAIARSPRRGSRPRRLKLLAPRKAAPGFCSSLWVAPGTTRLLSLNNRLCWVGPAGTRAYNMSRTIFELAFQNESQPRRIFRGTFPFVKGLSKKLSCQDPTFRRSHLSIPPLEKKTIDESGLQCRKRRRRRHARWRCESERSRKVWRILSSSAVTSYEVRDGRTKESR